MDLGQGGCGDIAFYFNSDVNHGATIPSQLSVFPDGSQPDPKSKFKCGSCGKEMFYLPILEYVKDNERYKKGCKDAD